MSPQRFIEIMEECYAPYPAPLKSLIGQWLEKKQPEYIGILSRVMLETHPTEYGKPPGISTFTKAHSAILDQQESLAMKIAGSKPLMIESETEKPVPAEIALELIGRILDNLAKGRDSRKDQVVNDMIENAEKESKNNLV